MTVVRNSLVIHYISEGFSTSLNDLMVEKDEKAMT